MATFNSQQTAQSQTPGPEFDPFEEEDEGGGPDNTGWYKTSAGLIPLNAEDGGPTETNDDFSKPQSLEIRASGSQKGRQDGFGLSSNADWPTLPPNPKWAFDMPKWLRGSNAANNHNYSLNNANRVGISMDTGSERRLKPFDANDVEFLRRPMQSRPGEGIAAYQGGPDDFTKIIAGPVTNLPPMPPVIMHGRLALDTDGPLTRNKYQDPDFQPKAPGKIDENGNITPAKYCRKHGKVYNDSNIDANSAGYGVVPGPGKSAGQFQLGDAETITRDDNGISATVPIGDYGPAYKLIKKGKRRGEVQTTGFGEVAIGTAQNELYVPIAKTRYGPRTKTDIPVTTTIYPGTYQPATPATMNAPSIRLSPFKK